MNKIIDKARNYCAYQERCHQEVKSKCFDWGLHANEIDVIISQLIEEGFLNEERFAKAYCRGKFLHNNWGRIKIKQQLKFKQISDYCIQKGLEELENLPYIETIKSLGLKYFQSIKGLKSYQKKMKTANFLLGKGFESDLVWQFLNELE